MATERKQAISHFLFKCCWGKRFIPYVLQIAQKVDNILILFYISVSAEEEEKLPSTEETLAQHFCGDQVTWDSWPWMYSTWGREVPKERLPVLTPGWLIASWV